MSNDKIISVSLKHLQDSPTNTRQTYNEASLQELAESIKSQGVLQPVVVRPFGMPDRFPSTHELVFGHRRARAARLAGLEFIPAILRDLDDEQVATAQIHENLQREDVTPLEEAAGLQRLLREFKHTPAQIMKETGKGKTYVYGRLKLLRLCPAVQQALAEGLPVDVAQEIATIPTETLQLKALDDVRVRVWNGAQGDWVNAGWLSARQAETKLSSRRYFVPIANGRFSLTDTYGLEPTRSCDTCSLRSTNSDELSDAFKVDTCTDVECFDARAAADRDRLIAWHREAGTLIEGPAAIHGFNTLYSSPSHKIENGVIGLRTSVLTQDGAPTIGEVIEQMAAAGDPTPNVKLLAHGATTELVVMRKDLPALWEAAGLVNPWTASSTATQGARESDDADDDGDSIDDDDEAQPSLQLPPTAEETAARDDWPAMQAAILKAAAARHRTTEDLRYIVAYEINCLGEIPYGIAPALGLTAELEKADEDGKDEDEWLIGKLPELSPDQLGLILLGCAIDNALDGVGKGTPALWAKRVEMARRFGVLPTALDKPAAPPPAAPTPSPAARASTKPVARYRNPATLETWSGRGLQPKWLKVAIAEGAKLSDFAIQQGLLAAAGVEAAQ